MDLCSPRLTWVRFQLHHGPSHCTIFYHTPATLDRAERLLAEAANDGAQIVVFPEAFIGGYSHGSNFGVSIGNRTAKGKEEFRKYHSAANDVPDKS